METVHKLYELYGGKPDRVLVTPAIYRSWQMFPAKNAAETMRKALKRNTIS